MPFVLAQFGLGDQPWVDPVVAVVVVLVSMAVAALVHLAVFPLIMHLSQHTPTELDGILIQAARWPVNMGIVVLGIYLSLTLTLDLPGWGAVVPRHLRAGFGGAAFRCALGASGVARDGLGH